MRQEDYDILLENLKFKRNKNKKTKRIIAKKKKSHKDRFKSNLERDYAQKLSHLKWAGEIVEWRYEPLGFRLAANTYYYPDFQILKPDGTIEFHETKGRVRQTGRAKWKIAAEMYPEFVWYWVTRERKEWKFAKYDYK